MKATFWKTLCGILALGLFVGALYYRHLLAIERKNNEDANNRYDQSIKEFSQILARRTVTSTNCPHSDPIFPKKNAAFLKAVEDLKQLDRVDGVEVGPGGSRGAFHQLFPIIYSNGTASDFMLLASFAKQPAVRIVGFLCLNYRDKSLAKSVFLKCGATDCDVIAVFPGGCIGSPMMLNEIYLEILLHDNFLETHKLLAQPPITPSPKP